MFSYVVIFLSIFSVTCMYTYIVHSPVCCYVYKVEFVAEHNKTRLMYTVAIAIHLHYSTKLFSHDQSYLDYSSTVVIYVMN